MRIYITRNARDGLWFNYNWPSGVDVEAVVAKPDKANETALKNVQVDLVKASKFGDGQCLNGVQSELSFPSPCWLSLSLPLRGFSHCHGNRPGFSER